MSFRCANCNEVADRQTKVVIERKMVQHTPQTDGPRGGRGSQIVKEISVCTACVGKVQEAPIERAAPDEIAPGITLNGQELPQ
jgi:hypothetical protein